MKKILTTSLLALAAAAFSIPSANAALSYNDGDLIVALRGGTSTYLINLGNVAQFETTLHDGDVHTLANISGDIAGANPTVWSIQASDPFALQSTGAVWGSKAETTAGVGSIPWTNDSSSGLATPAFGIQSMGTAYASGTEASVAGGSLQLNSTTNSYRSFQAGGANNSTGIAYDYFQPGFEGTIAVGSASSVLDLYRLDATDNGGSAGNSFRLGGFQITSSGAINFSSDLSDFGPAVPEPGTFAFGFALIGACFAGRFRTRRESVELVA